MTRPRPHRRKRTKSSRHEQALLAWLELRMADPVAARLALRVVGMHAGLIAWIADAERSRVLPQPFRLPGDERTGGVNVGGIVSGSREPDAAMWRQILPRLNGDRYDPEQLDPIRHRMTHKLGELAGWYGEQVGLYEVTEWEGLAVRLGDLIGDQVAANALALCLMRHSRMRPEDRHRKNARERWRRLAEWYVRVLDEQPNPRRRVPVESVGLDGERRIG